MKIDKQRQLDILLEINEILRIRKVKASVYLFGGSSLISQDIISRPTKDMDFFMFFVVNASENIPDEIKKQFKMRIDICVNGEFEIKSKGFKWKLPAESYKRAAHICNYSNLDVFALSPLDIVALKCDRLNDRDQNDISSVFKILKPPREQVVSIFEEYSKLLEGNKSSIDNIRENFYQLVLAIYDLMLKK